VLFDEVRVDLDSEAGACGNMQRQAVGDERPGQDRAGQVGEG
jgi:hypothetical protein